MLAACSTAMRYGTASPRLWRAAQSRDMLTKGATPVTVAIMKWFRLPLA